MFDYILELISSIERFVNIPSILLILSSILLLLAIPNLWGYGKRFICILILVLSIGIVFLGIGVGVQESRNSELTDGVHRITPTDLSALKRETEKLRTEYQDEINRLKQSLDLQTAVAEIPCSMLQPSSVNGERYELSRLSSSKLVSGKPGIYASVFFKKSDRHYIDFSERAYTAGDASDSLSMSIELFFREIIRPLKKCWKMDIFARGRADARTFRGILGPEQRKSQLMYLRTEGQDVYMNQPKLIIIEGVIDNADLANIRAIYLAQIGNKLSGAGNIQLLQGVTFDNLKPESRRAEFIVRFYK